MTKQNFPFYFLLQERAKPILPPLPPPSPSAHEFKPLSLRPHPPPSPPPSLPRANLNPPNHPHPPPTHPPIPHKKWLKVLFHIYYIDIVSKHIMPHKSVDVICQCGAILNVYYMPKHLKTAKHARDIIGRVSSHTETPEGRGASGFWQGFDK